MATAKPDSTTTAVSTRRSASAVVAPLDACPRCRSEAFHAEPTDDRPVFRCMHCGVGWIYELGYARAFTDGPEPLWRAAKTHHTTSM